MSLAAAESIVVRCAPRRVAGGAVATAAIVLANLILLFGAGHTSILWKWGLDVAVLGTILSHVFLLGLWLALGGQHWLTRLIVVSAPALFLGRAVNYHVPDVPPWEESLLIAGVCLTAVLCHHWLLAPLRWFGSLRLGFAPPQSASSAGRMQMHIRQLLAWTIWCALPCALARAIAPDHVFELLASIALFSGFAVPLAATTALLVLGRRKLLWLVACAAAWGFSTALKQLIPDMFDTPRMWEFNLAVAATVGINLSVLRLCGLRLWRAGPTVRSRGENSAAQAAP